ncbi:hypothetical protein FB45DRAFT_917254 [Roridomyces roridus]|uniref:Uncharacterized protein n=1 Tax=Roridomyces roridus TaxID=1738132 RepID=A0AAD7BUS9_9AGAR|nr:hypothetical protein FB45DRAFT_917254 [Roridomyces roridus]
MSAKSPSPPSPGASQIPGAWPSSSHRRSTTCPTPRPVIDSLHLVRDFQQRLVSQMDQSVIPYSGSSSSAIGPVDSLDSDLTRFRTDTSTSMITVSSFCSALQRYNSIQDTSFCTTPERPVLQFASKTKYSAVENSFPTRIPRPTRVHSPRDSCQNVFGPDSPPSRHPVPVFDTSASSISLDCNSNGSPVSPIIFSSPTSSTFPRFPSKFHPSPATRSLSYNSSPSWETSYGSEYNDRHMLDPSPSPSPSPITGRPSLAPRMSTTNRTPSIEINAAVPMLTSLSLPASPENSMSLELDLVSRSPRLSPIDGNTSPWSLSLSPVSPVLSVVPDLSLSPLADEHVVSFPSSSPFESPLPSPVLDEVANTSAADYAAAVMSSAWASDGPSMSQVIPQGLVLPDIDSEDEVLPNPEAPMDATADEIEPPAPLAYRESVEYIPARIQQEGKRQGVIGKMKKFGDRVKRLLRGKPKAAGGVNIDVDVRVGSLTASPLPDDLPDVIDIQSPHAATAQAQAYNNLLPNHDNSSHVPLPLPPPPGLLIRKTKTRPILSSHMEQSGQTAPAIRICPPGVASKAPSPDLAIHSRPKTLAEIKSKRRLSLSTLTSFTRSPSPINVVTSSNNHRARPASALAFYSRPHTTSNHRGEGNDANPNLLAVPASTSRQTVPDSVIPNTTRPISMRPSTSTLPRDSQDATKKKNRRFSFSALSSFAAGTWEDNSASGLRF